MFLLQKLLLYYKNLREQLIIFILCSRSNRNTNTNRMKTRVTSFFFFAINIYTKNALGIIGCSR